MQLPFGIGFVTGNARTPQPLMAYSGQKAWKPFAYGDPARHMPSSNQPPQTSNSSTATSDFRSVWPALLPNLYLQALAQLTLKPHLTLHNRSCFDHVDHYTVT